jgi:predicted nucleotidyltransferase
MLLHDLGGKKLIHPPSWLSDNCQYLTMMGSVAYGVSGDTSDVDVYGWTIPPKSLVFPHLAGEIPGFGKQHKRFDQFQQHHVLDENAAAGKGKEYDLSIYSIIRFFQLCMENNPNMVDSLYTPQFCVLHSTQTGNMVRDKRDMFLHKGCWHKFRGYAFSQLSKADAVKNDKDVIAIRKYEDDHNLSHDTTYDVAKKLVDPEYISLFENGMNKTKRFESQKRFNTDVKFLYHLARLLDECEQILTLGTIDLMRSREYLKAIRKGEVSEDDLRNWFTIKEKELEKMYTSSLLQYGPDEVIIKQLLLDCLEHHYGSLDKCVINPDQSQTAIFEIGNIIDRYRSQFSNQQPPS